VKKRIGLLSAGLAGALLMGGGGALAATIGQPSSTGVTTDCYTLSGNGGQPAPQGSQPAPQGSQPAPQGSQPAPQGSQPAPQGSQPAPQGSQPAPQAGQQGAQGDQQGGPCQDS
jgi:hypothetical protein